MSSAEGFPDNSPKLEPWESCIPVLDKAFVMILVIDGRYGASLKWPNCGDLFKDKQVSPTHGEYLYAHKNRKRMIVFIRSEVMTYYQSYRRALENCDSVEKAEELLIKTLPEYIDFKTLKFVHEVKTTKPIPWIVEFDNITSVKKEVQKKMLNELAEIFLVKDMHLETVIDSFNKALASLSVEEQKKVLLKIDVTKDLTETVDKIDKYQKELDIAKKALDDTTETNTLQKQKYEKKISELEKDISKLEAKSFESRLNKYYIKEGKIQVGTPKDFVPVTVSPFPIIGSKQCVNCGKVELGFIHEAHNNVVKEPMRKCPDCKRNLCSKCWPKSYSKNTYLFGQSEVEICPRCIKNLGTIR